MLGTLTSIRARSRKVEERSERSTLQNAILLNYDSPQKDEFEPYPQIIILSRNRAT
jgi:hypothetical protein